MFGCHLVATFSADPQEVQRFQSIGGPVNFPDSTGCSFGVFGVFRVFPCLVWARGPLFPRCLKVQEGPAFVGVLLKDCVPVRFVNYPQRHDLFPNHSPIPPSDSLHWTARAQSRSEPLGFGPERYRVRITYRNHSPSSKPTGRILCLGQHKGRRLCVAHWSSTPQNDVPRKDERDGRSGGSVRTIE